MKAATVPASIPRSSTFAVRIDGAPAEVYGAGPADFVLLSGDEAFTLEIALPRPTKAAAVHPLRLGIPAAVINGSTVRISFDKPINAYVEIAGFKPLFLFASPAETDRPDPAAPGVRYYGGGRVYDEGVLTLHSGETLYVEAGTVLHACLFADHAENIRICGGGVIDGDGIHHQMVLMSHCRNCRIENVTLVRPHNWMVLLGGCDGILVDNLHEIGEVVCSDGIDMVGSSHIEVRGCLLCNNDDCVVVKAQKDGGYTRTGNANWGENVHDIHIHGCSFYNLGAGNAMEIGFELRSDVIEDVVFEDLDVLAAHQNAAVFSIHDGDHATVRHILYRDIRVEHYWNKLVDFRIMQSRYTKDDEPGHIEDVRFEHIQCVPNVFNTPSIIGGFDPQHRVSGVVFEDFRLGDHAVRSAHELQLYTVCADGIEFR